MAGLVLHPFATDRLVVVAPRDHGLSATRWVRLADLTGKPFLTLAEGALQDHPDAQVGLRWQPRIRPQSFDDICRMAGAGVGIVPETAARRARASARTTIVRLTEDWATRRLSLCLRAGADLAPLTRDSLEHLAHEK